jgi:hypothetical protein
MMKMMTIKLGQASHCLFVRNSCIYNFIVVIL